MAGRLDGKVAWVTGGASGIGEGIVKAFVAEGAKVAIVDVSGAQDALAKELGEATIAVHADVSKGADVQAALKAAVDAFGGIDIIVNNAGIDGAVGPLAEYSEEDYDKVMGINAKGVFLGLRYGIPLLLQRGGGSVINTASMAADVAFPGMNAYCASKGAVVMLTKTAAAEYAGQNIRVNAVKPGAIRTAITDSLPPELINGVKNATPVGRYGTTAELGALAVYLASDESKFVTGSDILIDGGYCLV